MNQAQLALLRQRVVRMAHTVMVESQHEAESDLLARAWSRLVDSAFALESLYARREQVSSPPIVEIAPMHVSG